MAKSPLEDVVYKWGRKAQEAQAAGVSFDKIKPLAKYDIEKVMHGGQSWSNMETNLAIAASATGHPIIQPPKHSGILDVLGNVGTDVAGLVKGFVPGVVRTVWHLPSEVEATGEQILHSGNKKWLEQHGYDPKGTELSPSGFAAALRNVAEAGKGGGRTPLFSLIPGIDAAAKLTTGEGRELIREHPVGTALGVLPLAGKAAQLGTLGRVAEEGSAIEALQAGRPVKALSRATGLESRKITTLQRLGMDPETAQKLVRPYSIATRKLHSDSAKFFKEHVEPIVGKLSEEERRQLFDEAANYKPHDPAISPEHHAILQNVRRLQDTMAQYGESKGSLFRIPGPDGKSHVYAATSPVVKQARKIAALGTKLKNAKTGEKAIAIKKQMMKEQRKLATSMLNHPPAAFHNIIEKNVRTRAEALARTKYQGDSLTSALRDIRESTSWQDFSAIVGEKQFNSMVKDSMHEWVRLSENGFDPIWMHHVPEARFGRLLYPRPLPDHYIKPGQWQDKAFNFSPHMHDISVAVTDAGVEILKADATKQFVDDVVSPLSRRAGDIKNEIRDSLRDRYPDPERLAAAVETEIDKRYARFDPANPFSGNKARTGHDEDALIPRHVDHALDGLMGSQRRLPVKGAWDRSMNLFKFSVLIGPRHIVHVGVGGLMFSLLREPGTILQIPKAVGIVKRGEIPIELPQSLYGLETDQIFNISRGKSMAKHFAQAVGNKAHAIARFEEHVSNVERTAAYLSASKRGLDHEAALQAASKVFIDMDKMMPVERYLIKQIFPFYAFTKHLFRYLFTYPIDHPVRAAILSRFAEHEMEEWNTGLPLKYQQLFFLGSGDVKTAVDFKAVNPFRSFGNDFSLVGFVQSLNPLAATTLSTMGVNPVTAVPELYPDVNYDPITGSLQGKRHNFFQALAESFVPETRALEAFIGTSDKMRNLRDRNPDAYRRMLFSALNIPFDFGDVSMSEIRGKSEVARLNAAQRAVSEGQATGNFSQARAFNVVPFRGELVSPSQVADFWSQLQDALRGGVNPKAVLTPYRGRRSKR